MDDEIDMKADDRASKRAKRKLLMDTASKVVDMITAVSETHDDMHYVMDVMYNIMSHEEPCKEHQDDE